MKAHQKTRNHSAASTGPFGRSLAAPGLVLALTAAAAEALAGFGTRWGLWYYRTGLAIFGISGIVGAVSAIVSLIGGIFAGRHRFAYRTAVAGIVMGLATTGILWSWSEIGLRMPKIHDISTDTLNPPQFIAVLPYRKYAENPAGYGGPEVAAQQQAAYPDVQPLVLPLNPQVAFDRSVKVARDMGWDIVGRDERQGRIEATATTFWFGFKDDVVVRVAAVQDGSRIDVRSASRVGLSDVGTNAKRIRVFLQKMKSASAG